MLLCGGEDQRCWEWFFDFFRRKGIDENGDEVARVNVGVFSVTLVYDRNL
jgi:hypothetical protein